MKLLLNYFQPYLNKVRLFKYLQCLFLAGLLAFNPFYTAIAKAHSVAQANTTQIIAPETQQLINSRGGSLLVGDIASFIVRFEPVENGATVGPGGYVTAYVPTGTEVVKAEIVEPDSSGGYRAIPPKKPGKIADGWGRRNKQSFNGWTTSDAETISKCSNLSDCNGSLAQLYADTGIFYSTDSRTRLFTADNSGIASLTNGYRIAPTGGNGVANALKISSSQITTHNLWDASQVNAFGTKDNIPSSTPRSDASVINDKGVGTVPYNAGSPVAGSDSGYKLDNTGNVGPWKRIAYSGSRIGNPTGAATSQGTLTADYTTGVGQDTNAGWNLSPSHPLPNNTNAVRFSIGRIQVGETRYVKVSFRIKPELGNHQLVFNSEVFGGDSAEEASKHGQDNPWRYHAGAVAVSNNGTVGTLVAPAPIVYAD
jgi:hypothetical protein